MFPTKEQEEDHGYDFALYYIIQGDFQAYYNLKSYNEGDGIVLLTLKVFYLFYFIYFMKFNKSEDSFGVYSFITGEKREMNMKSLNYGRLYKLTRKTFLDVLKEFP